MRSTHTLCIALTLRVSHLRLLLLLFLFAPLFAGADPAPPASQPTYDYDNTLPVYRYPSLIGACQALLDTPMWGNVKASGALPVVENNGVCYFVDPVPGGVVLAEYSCMEEAHPLTLAQPAVCRTS